jgi:hypothetical protein
LHIARTAQDLAGNTLRSFPERETVLNSQLLFVELRVSVLISHPKREGHFVSEGDPW